MFPMSSPLVTVVVACRDNESQIERCIRSVQAQSWPADRLEILVADGMSVDATREILGRLAQDDPRIRLIDNAAGVPAAGLNECIRRARGDVVVRVDVDGERAHNFVERCVDVLYQSGADSVGGASRPKTHSFFQRCVAAALRSPLCARGSQQYDAHHEGYVDSVRAGAFRRAVFERVGVFDAAAVSNEDAELDQRIVEGGGRVYMSRDIVSYYRPRESMRELADEQYRCGLGSARSFVKHGRLPSFGPAIPFLGLAFGAVMLAVAPGTAATLSLGAYALVTGAEAVRVGRAEGTAAIAVVWAIFPVLHLAHGAGFGAGLVRYAIRPDWSAPERLATHTRGGPEPAE
jgi:glycosyltransferase involved in cell wall biosynthesis